jgi:hypothetical protein
LHPTSLVPALRAQLWTWLAMTNTGPILCCQTGPHRAGALVPNDQNIMVRVGKSLIVPLLITWAMR